MSEKESERRERVVAVGDDNARKMLDWIRNRGGIAVWTSRLIGGTDGGYYVPAKTAEGKGSTKPHWSAGDSPDFVVTDSSDVRFVQPREVGRFRVAIRKGSQGLAYKCTDVSTLKIRKAVEKAGGGSWHEFDYSSQEAVIYSPDGGEMTLRDWEEMIEREKGRQR